jgi:hypothetical protein
MDRIIPPKYIVPTSQNDRRGLQDNRQVILASSFFLITTRSP